MDKNMNSQNPGDKDFDYDNLNKDREFNERNAGRKSDEPDMIAKRMLFDCMVNGGFSEPEILKEMEISHKTFKRYEDSLERLYLYYDLFNVYPESIHRFSPINKFSIMADFLKKILESENADKLDKSWIAKAKDRIKNYEKLGSLIDQNKYKSFSSRRFDDIVMGYAASTFDWLREHHWNENIKAAAKTLKEVYLETMLCDMQNGMSPEEAECLYTGKPYMPQSDGLDEKGKEESDYDKEEKTCKLDYSKMREFKHMYESGSEYEPDEEAYEIYKVYKNWADRLKMAGYESCIPCLSCPGLYRVQGDDLAGYGCETLENCELGCADAYRDCESQSCGEMDRLFDYFLGERS